MRRWLVLPLAVATAMGGTTAAAKERDSYAFLRRHPAGVGARATYNAPASHVNTGGGAATFAPSAERGPLASLPAPVAISAHNCIPRTDARGVSLSFEFAEGGGADCLSFVSPTPVPRRPRPNGRRLRRPSPESLAQAAYDRVISLAPGPDLTIAPARVGLTGLPSYFWAGDELGPISATAGVRGLSVTAEARPVAYLWDFGDGTTRQTRHGGRPWTETRRGNVGHLYETKGRYEVALEVVWAARWRIGDGAWRDLGYFSTTDSAGYPVREMISVLVRRR